MSKAWMRTNDAHSTGTFINPYPATEGGALWSTAPGLREAREHRQISQGHPLLKGAIGPHYI